MILVVASLAITHHGHDVGKGHSRAVILVSIKEDAEALEVIRGAKNRALSSTLLCEPQGESIPV